MQFDTSDDKKKALEHNTAGEGDSIAEVKEAIATISRKFQLSWWTAH